MREKFWSMIVDFKIAERYYWHYTHNSRNWNNAISAISLLTSASGISAWYFWNRHPLIWAAIIAAAQVIGVLKPLMPFSDRLMAAQYIYQDIGALLIDMEYIWGADGSNISEKTFKKYIQQYEKKYTDIENRFSKPDLFSSKLKLHDKAQKEASMYFEIRYNTKKEGDYV